MFKTISKIASVKFIVCSITGALSLDCNYKVGLDLFFIHYGCNVVGFFKTCKIKGQHSE